VLVRTGDLNRARSTAQYALERLEALGDDRTLMVGLVRTGAFYFETGELAKYIELMDRHIQLARHLGDRMLEIVGLSNLGEAYSQLGLYRLARSCQEQASQVAESIGARRSRAYASWNLGSVYLQMGHSRRAQALLEEALEEFRAIKDLYAEAGAQMEMALVAEKAGDLAGAERRYAQAREKLLEMGIISRASEATAGLARCALAQGHLNEARQYIDQVSDFLKRTSSTAENPFRMYQACAEVYLALGEDELAHLAVEAGNLELWDRSQRIGNSEWRKSFLDNVPENSALVRLGQRFKIPLSDEMILSESAGKRMVLESKEEEER
jgi:tetratricopeptide (TPR) repeat protein